MFFPQALQTLVYWGWLTPVHTHAQLFTPMHSRSHLLTLTPAYIHHTCSHSLSPAHKSQLSVSLPHFCIRRRHVEP